MMLIFIGKVVDNNLVTVQPNSAEGKEKVLLLVEEIISNCLCYRCWLWAFCWKLDGTKHFIAFYKRIASVKFSISKLSLNTLYGYEPSEYVSFAFA